MPTSRWIALSSTCICSRSLRSRAPERLVEQQHPRPVDQRAGQRDPLPLAAGELRSAARPPKPPSRTASSASSARGRALRLADALDHQAVGDVLHARVMCGNSA